MKRSITLLVISLLITVFTQNSLLASDGTIRIGFNIPLSGMFELVGNHSKNAAELVRKEIASQGGLKVGKKVYDVEFLYGDNGSNPSMATTLAVQQIAKDKVIGIVGPLSSRQSIPVGLLANSYSTPMISPWSTSPITTKDRPFVFRSCFEFTVQGPVLTKFVANEFKATKGAILYDIISAYPRGMANAFKDSFENTNGAGSIVAFEEFRTGEMDFKSQLYRIKQSDAEFIFTPQHYNEVPLIVRQAKEIGLEIPIIGSNSWAGGNLVGECGEDCNGLYFTGNYAPGSGTPINTTFIEQYTTAYKEDPDEPAALTWDATRALLAAIQKSGKLNGNLLADRIAVKDSLVKVKDFEGASGVMSFNESGTPKKCAVIVKIDNGLQYYDSVCP